SHRDRIDRRTFIHRTGAWLTLGAAGCATVAPRRPSSEKQDRFPLPFAEVSGEPYDCGRALGRRFAPQINTVLRRRSAQIDEMLRFVEADPASRYQPFLDAGKRHFPEIVSELSGWADGAGVPFKKLLVFNLKAELKAMMQKRREEAGCSTLVFSRSGQGQLIAHNEDNDVSFADQMFFIKVKPTGKSWFLCQCYPGILPGNAPGLNGAGLVLTTNFIASTRWKAGIPRYFIDRAVLGARSPSEAIKIVCHPQRAFAFHYNIGSTSGTPKIWSVETSVDRHVVREVEGLYAHTNHLVLPATREAGQDDDYVRTSSMPRYRALSRHVEQLAGRQVTGSDLIAGLSSHEGRPYSPCRHVTNSVRGTTVACSLFDLQRRSWLFFKGHPCAGRSSRIPV
ncbi:MAG: hypothetical protein JRI55_33775, partial [Deltaproteobacteria bacterium]|nr:hypothetical protein [Deltaproteobacteria bacterium]